jgi:hypothetical protein
MVTMYINFKIPGTDLRLCKSFQIRHEAIAGQQPISEIINFENHENMLDFATGNSESCNNCKFFFYFV